ncbi:MAG TPA: hypothetical protein PLV21_18610 [Cyclobacteriaceae bacterium]|nr:hypothetical protein [Cyclobacteriaceae bacterium]HRJ83905.1 hypothetical protein [Cyclobacteriaceae bacterium]
MKAFIFFLFYSLSAFKILAQNEGKQVEYRIGLGPAIEGNVGLFAVNFTNEISFNLNNRANLNASVTYFQSLGDLERSSVLYFNTHSGFFTNLTFSYNLFKTNKGFYTTLEAGPSFQVGSSTYQVYAEYVNNQWIYEYEIENHSRLGFVTSLALGWGNNRSNTKSSSILISIYSFDNYYGYFLMTTYRFGFLVKRQRE